MPRTGILGNATRIDPVPADHDALEGLGARDDAGAGELVLRTAEGTEISLPPSLLRLVVSAARDLAAGRTVMAIAAEVTLTPAEAAELLGLSRPFVAKLLERGDIPSEFLPGSRHRRVRLEDVLAFQRCREHRAEGRRRIADIADTAGLPYLCGSASPYIASSSGERCDEPSPCCGGEGDDCTVGVAFLLGVSHQHAAGGVGHFDALAALPAAVGRLTPASAAQGLS